MYDLKKIQITGCFINLKELDSTYYLVSKYNYGSEDIVFRLNIDDNLYPQDLENLNFEDVTVKGQLMFYSSDPVINVEHIWLNKGKSNHTKRLEHILL